jgi:outer membrane protein assembly factor BamB
MDRMRGLIGVALATVLVGCGGGGGGGRSPTPVTPAPVPTASLTAQTGTMPLQLAWLDETSLTITGTVSWTNLPAGVHIVATDLGNYFGPTKVQQVATAGAYSLTMSGNPELAPGSYSGSVTVQACQDGACLKPFANTAVTLPYSLVVAAVDEWSTYQRTSAHNAYVPITLNPSRFAFKWAWNTTDSLGALLFEQGPNNHSVTDEARVYTSTGSIRAEGYVFAVDKATGRPAWSKSLGMSYMTNPPAVKDGVVYVATAGYFTAPDGEVKWGNSFLWAFDAADGDLLFKTRYPTSIWDPYFLAPTVAGGKVFLNGGTLRLTTFAFDALTGDPQWAQEIVDGVPTFVTPAVNTDGVFNANPFAVSALDAATGALKSSVPVVESMQSSGEYASAPVISNKGSVLALSGNGYQVTINSPIMGYGTKRALNRFTTFPLGASWSTQPLYDSTPVVANGVVYAYRYDPAQLDALDEATGQLLWSWALPEAEGASFYDNLIVTNNLLFFGTNSGLKALDLKTREIVWRLQTPACFGICRERPGTISMSADRILFVTHGLSITAVSLR